MSENTTQVEGLEFVAHDHASGVAARIGKSFEHVYHATEKARDRLKEFSHHTVTAAAAAVGLGFGFHAIMEKAKEANAELDGASKKIAGVVFAFSGWKAGTSAQERWAESLREGTEVVEKLEESEGNLKMGRGELADIYKSSFALGERYRLSQQDMLDLTEKLGAAQKVLGVNAESASDTINRAALTGRIRGFDDFSKTLRFAVGDLKKFAKLSETARFEKLQKAMGDLMPAAIGMGQGLKGAMFDISEAIEDIVRDVSKPVFKEVVRAAKEWAHHLTQVRENGKSIAREVGDKLVTAFHALETASKFIAQNWKEILAAWGAYRMSGAAQGWANVAGEIAGKAGGNASFTGAIARATSGLLGMAAKASMVVAGLVAFKTALEGAASYLDKKHDESRAQHAAAPRAMTTLTAGAKAMSSAMHEDSVEKTMGHLRTAFAAYGLKPGQALSASEMAKELRAMEPELAARQIGMFGIKGMTAQTVSAPGTVEEAAGRITMMLTNFADALVKAYPQLGEGESKRVPGKPDLRVQIGTVEIHPDFKDPNPDRVFHRMVNEIVDMSLNPRGSVIPAVPG